MEWKHYPPPDDTAQHTVVGTMRVLPDMEVPQLESRRDILAYLPPSYGSGDRRYPVLYMHDGQNLFDSATAFTEEWHVDRTMEDASRRGLEAIVIGIPNAGDARVDEYSPFVDAKVGGGRGDAYLEFLVHTLKPLVDAEFRTRPERECTGILGSSMGGLISLYAFFRQPEVFGLAGVMSPSLWFAGGAIFPFVVQSPFSAGRIYLDVGTAEGDTTVRNARKMRRILHRKGYEADHDLRYIEEEGAGHTEAAWAQRFMGAVDFLLPR